MKGIFDYLNPIFPELIIIAPSKKGGLLEGSKKFAKEFMHKYDIPTAKYASFKSKEFEKGLKLRDQKKDELKKNLTGSLKGLFK